MEGERMIKDVRNTDGKLVAQINKMAGEVIIVKRGCVTKLCIKSDGTIGVMNTKEFTA